MVRGFTLLELLITVSIVTLMLAFAAPSYRYINQNMKMVNLANELQGFFVQAKSEAVFRNQGLWVHIEGMPSSTGEWQLRLSSDALLPSNEESDISVFSGARYRNLSVNHTRSINSVRFDHVMGNPTQNGSITIKAHVEDSQGIRVILHNRAGRIKVCTIQGDQYGFSSC